MSKSKAGDEEKKMKTYLVKWTIDIDAETMNEAVRKARTIQQDSKSIATVFEVFDSEIGLSCFIDALEISKH